MVLFVKKATLVVCHKRIVKAYRTDEPWGIEERLVKLAELAVGYVVAVLTSIPGSLDPESARDIPCGILVGRDGETIDTGAVTLRCVSRCMTRLYPGDPIYDDLEEAIGAWARMNRDRWRLEPGANGDMWRSVAFTAGYHAVAHTEHRVGLARWRMRLAQEAKAAHERDVEQWAKEQGSRFSRTGVAADDKRGAPMDFPHPALEPGQTVRLTCETFDGERWETAGRVEKANWDGYLILDGPDGQILWSAILKVDVLESECQDHWHCDPALAAHNCENGTKHGRFGANTVDRTKPCPTCSAQPSDDDWTVCGECGKKTTEAERVDHPKDPEAAWIHRGCPMRAARSTEEPPEENAQ
jgi:hypothetical protein